MEKSIGKDIEKINTVRTMISGTPANPDLGVTQKYSRHLYENTAALKKYKSDWYGDRKRKLDPYTGKHVQKSHVAARNSYGRNYAKYASETDHIVALKEGHDVLKLNPFLSDQDIREIMNSPKNFREISRMVNNQKRDTDDLAYITGIKWNGKENKIERFDTGLTISGKARMAGENIGSKVHISAGATVRTAKNVGGEFISGAGDTLTAAAFPLMILGVQNICEVASGEKTMEDAGVEMAEAAGQVALIGGGTKVAKTALSGVAEITGQKFLKKIMENSNEIAQIVSVGVIVTRSFVKLVNDEIGGVEFFEEIGESGVGLVGDVMGSIIGSGVAGALFPASIAAGPAFPVVAGALIGGIIVSTVCTEIYRYTANLRKEYLAKEKAYSKRIAKLNRVADQAIAVMQYEQRQLKDLIDAEYAEWTKKFETGFQTIVDSMFENDFEKLSRGLGNILEVFGETVLFANMEEFDEFFFDDDAVLTL